MAAVAAGDGADFFARALFGKRRIDQAVEIKYNEKGKPVVYGRRWLVLAAYGLSYFMWNFGALKYTPLVPEFALYFNIPNEVSLPPDFGVDFITVWSNLLLIVFYPISGQMVDSFGLVTMKWGSIGLTISAWWWYFSYRNYISVLISLILLNFSGSLVASCLLRLANNWFSEKQRALAVAIAAIVTTLGSGVALVIGPFFSTGPQVVNFDLKSCEDSFILANTNQTTNESAILGTDCTENEDAIEAFCCAAPTEIELLNLAVAVITTLIAVFTFVVTEDAPKTPPSKAGIVRRGPSFIKALKIMFKHRNYTQICAADFFSSGPPLVVFTTVDRIFPPSVTEYSTIAAAAAVLLAIPAAGIFTTILSKTKKFYEMTAAGYVSGAVCFTSVALLVLAENDITDILVLVLGGASVMFFMLWSVSVYELKMEYVFSSEYAIQGYIVAVDRTIINLSSVIFVAAIPPERFSGDLIDGRQFTFLVGSVFIVFGAVLSVTVPNKRKYLRKEYEEGEQVLVNEVGHEDIEYPDEKKPLKVEKVEKLESLPAKPNTKMSVSSTDL